MITMSALAYSFWVVTFWYLLAMVVLTIWGSCTEEMAVIVPGFIGILLTIVYFIWLIIWLCVHWTQFHIFNIVHIVN